MLIVRRKLNSLARAPSSHRPFLLSPCELGGLAGQQRPIQSKQQTRLPHSAVTHMYSPTGESQNRTGRSTASMSAPEWRNGLRHCISVLEESLQTLVRSQALSQPAVIGSPIGRRTIGPASSGLGEGLAGVGHQCKIIICS
jgi:hypothetical protein